MVDLKGIVRNGYRPVQQRMRPYSEVSNTTNINITHTQHQKQQPAGVCWSAYLFWIKLHIRTIKSYGYQLNKDYINEAFQGREGSDFALSLIFRPTCRLFG